MHVIADLCLIPMGVGVSVSRHVAGCQRAHTTRGRGGRWKKAAAPRTGRARGSLQTPGRHGHGL